VPAQAFDAGVGEGGEGAGVDEVPEEGAGGQGVAHGGVQLFVRGRTEVGEQGPEGVVGRGVQQGAGEAEGVDVAEVEAGGPQALGLVRDEPKVELQIVPDHYLVLQRIQQSGQLAGDGVVGGIGPWTFPVEANAVVADHRHLTDAAAAIGA
jgi:hypothetical protein